LKAGEDVNKQIIALGFFDGVHLGHKALLHACRDLAVATGCDTAAALTFDTHPAALVRGKAPGLINTQADRLGLIHACDIHPVYLLHFDEAMRTMPWQEFFRLLLERYNAAGIVCGHDFRFGYRGEGTAEKLQAVCRDAGIPCTVVGEQTLDGLRVSSSHIRTLLEQGRVEEVNRFLGHTHILTGTVVPGKQLGRTIGVPTANLLLPPELAVPRFGVYACVIGIDGTDYAAVTNIGTRPTVNGQGVTVESWILDFQGDLYGRELTLNFFAFLRPERKFDSLEQLQAEIQKNAVQARKILGFS
jgi:riboflavin kinase/FMN adenylyltransferase